jgi:hypothetical protein
MSAARYLRELVVLDLNSEKIEYSLHSRLFTNIQDNFVNTKITYKSFPKCCKIQIYEHESTSYQIMIIFAQRLDVD